MSTDIPRKVKVNVRTAEARLPLFASIRAGERLWVTNRPQGIFRAKRFLIEDVKADSFVVHDIRVGRNSQLMAPGPMPLAVLGGATAETLFETCQVGQNFEMLIENVSTRDLGFSVLVIGDEPYGEPVSDLSLE